jgi:tripartite ATP-independent transporter DctM subunit
MNVGGTTERIFEVAKLLVGRVQGGLAHVNVLGSMLFAGMSGSAVADAAGLGVIEIRAMVKEGYQARYAATISAVSATIGPLIPPSIPFVIFASLANVSVGGLFLAGVVPGLLVGAGLMISIALTARRRNLPRSAGRPSWREARGTLAHALPALSLPPLILGAIFSGVVTPTEAAVLAAAAAYVIGAFIYKELSIAQLMQTLWESGRQTVQVMFIIAMSAPFGWVLVQQQVPNSILQSLLALSTEPVVILLIVNVVLLFLGMFLETVAIMIIAYPILAPVMASIGVDPIQFGVILVVNMMIGLVTPPVGLCLFVVAGIAKVPISEVVKELAPYLAALLVVLALVTYVPAISLTLPAWFGLGVVR